MFKVEFVNWNYLEHELNVVFSLRIVGSQNWANGARKAVEASERKEETCLFLLKMVLFVAFWKSNVV